MNKLSTYMYVLETIDPVHVGTGGYRLEYIDNTIVRNYDTIPKIPGSTLSGVARHYLAKAQTSQALGANCGGNNSKCDQGKCIVCKTFGIAKDGESRKGAMQFSDALLLFFPVATLAGTVWITTVERLKDFTESLKECYGDVPKADEQIINIVKYKKCNIPQKIDGQTYYNIDFKKTDDLKYPFLDFNGFVFIPTSSEVQIEVLVPCCFDKPLIVLSEKVFIQVVNRNLEVRTSIAINPKTGTVEEGALFTYEAIPRGSYLYYQLIFNPPNELEKESKMDKEIKEAVEKGMNYYGVAGIGGMTTRGFGRTKCVRVVYKVTDVC